VEHKVDLVWIERQIRPLRGSGEACQERVIELHCFRDGDEVEGRSLVQIDPQQLVLAQSAGESLVEFDLSILAARVVEPSARPDGRAGRGDQRNDARRTAPTMARAAMPYWRTSMDRSVRVRRGVSTVPTRRVRENG
jgi:hypothetical protein